MILSIDSKCFSGREELSITLPVTKRRKDVENFLKQLNSIIDDDEFDVNKNLFITRMLNDDGTQFSNKYLMIDLEYDESDIINRLKELKVENFIEARIDINNVNPPELYIFGMNINEREVYIKLKVRYEPNKQIVCISFHYAQRNLEYQFT